MNTKRAGPLFSIGIPTYNRPETTRQALESCLAQEFQDYEIIVSDGTPGDSVRQVVESFKSPRITYIKNDPPPEIIPKLNDLVERAAGEWMVFLCDDDLLDKSFLSRAAEVIRDHPDASLIHPRSRLMNHAGKYLGEDRMQAPVKDPIDLMATLFRPWYDVRMNFTGYLFPVQGMKDVGGIQHFFHTYFSDNIAWAKVGARGNAYFLPDALVSIREWPSYGRSTPLNYESIIEGREQVAGAIDTIFADLATRFSGTADLERARRARQSCVAFVVEDGDEFLHRIFFLTLTRDEASASAAVADILQAASRSKLPLLSSPVSRGLVRCYRLIANWPPGVRRLTARVLKKFYRAARIIRDRRLPLEN